MEEIQFRQAVIMPETGSVNFLVNIFEGSGNFEVSVNGNIKMTGIIRVPENIENERTPLPDVVKSEKFALNMHDVYTIFALRGYEYGGGFKCILSSNLELTSGEMVWMNNYAPFLDGLLQYNLINKNNRQIYLISKINKMTIDPLLHKQIAENIPKGRGIPLQKNHELNVIQSGGIEIKGAVPVYAPRRQRQEPILEKYIFVPYENSQPLDSDPNRAKLNALTVFLQIIQENVGINRIKAVELSENRPVNTLLAPLASDIISKESAFFVSKIIP